MENSKRDLKTTKSKWWVRLIRVEEDDDQPALHAVSDSSRWMRTRPMTGFTKVRSVLGQWSD